MNFKKVLAGVAAGSMVAAMSVTAFADQVTFEASINSEMIYTVDEDITTLEVVVDVTDAMTEEGAVPDWNDWCGAGVIVTLPDGTQNFYDFGGAQVGWGVDLDGDEEADTEGAGSASWVGNVSKDGGKLFIPVEKGATVEFKVLSWVKDEGTYDDYVQYTLTMGAAAETGDVAPVAYLAAVVALAGVAMVASKKARA